LAPSRCTASASAPSARERVAVIGLGLVGLLAGQSCGRTGCRVGIDPVPARRAGRTARVRGGASPEAAPSHNLERRGHGADIVIIAAAGQRPGDLAGELARDRATVVDWRPARLPRRSYYRQKELSVVVSRNSGGKADAERARPGLSDRLRAVDRTGEPPRVLGSSPRRVVVEPHLGRA
jgi:threonine dehydrogenase-like Zn-dependent dehydrogenase